MRYNIFYDVHTPLRTMLLKTCISLSNYHSFAGMEPVVTQKIEDVIQAFEEQVKLEETYILPLVFEYEPSVADIYVRQHRLQAIQLRELKKLLVSFKDEDLLDELDYRQIVSAFNDFIITNYDHMDDEEPVLNQFLWMYYNDQFLKGIQQKMVLKIPMVHQPKHELMITATAA